MSSFRPNRYRELQQVELQHGSRNEWAPEGELKAVSEPEKILRYQESAYDSMHERIPVQVSSRVAPQEHIRLLSRQ